MSSHPGHETVVCSACETVIRNCRCIGPKPTLKSLCDGCAREISAGLEDGHAAIKENVKLQRALHVARTGLKRVIQRVALDEAPANVTKVASEALVEIARIERGDA